MDTEVWRQAFLLSLVILQPDGQPAASLSEVSDTPTPRAHMTLISTLTVIAFVTILHGLTPRLGVWVMNVSSFAFADLVVKPKQ